MDQKTIRIIGYIIYPVCVAVIFTLMVKLNLIIRNGTVTLVIAAVISLMIAWLAEKLIAAIGKNRKTKN